MLQKSLHGKPTSFKPSFIGPHPEAVGEALPAVEPFAFPSKSTAPYWIVTRR